MLPLARATARRAQLLRLPKGSLASPLGGSSRRGFLTAMMTTDEIPPDSYSPLNGAPRYPSPWNKWFPYEPVPCSPYRGPVWAWCEEKVAYLYCTCGECPTQPWCEDDGNGCRGRGFEPLVYIPQHSGWKLLCGSKHSGSAPFFNGTCWLVWADYNPMKAAMVSFVGCFAFGVFSTWFAHP
jgi:hypothetical protein